MSLRNNNTWVHRFVVSDPTRHKKGFTIYKVTSIVFPKASPEASTKIVAWKRYNDFKKLHRELQTKHKQLHLQDSFPAFAKSKMFGRFDHDVIEERRQCALALLEFIGEHTLLFTSNVFVQFFETSYSIEDHSDTLPGNPSQTDIHSPMGFVSGDLQQPSTTSIPVEMSNSSTVANNNMEVNKPLLLGGTWQFPQVPECISLSSASSDDRTTFTDTDSSAVSGVSSPLQNVDLQFFDPLQQSPTHIPDSTIQSKSTTEHYESSNSWLLSMPSTSSSSLNEVHTQNCDLKQEQNKSATEISKPNPLLNVSNKKSVIGHTERPATSFLSVRTEDFEASNLSNIQLMSKSNGFNAILALSTDSHSEGHSDIQSLSSVNYIFEAAYHTSQAMLNEANGEFEAAFAFYKAGIACLLSGVQDETDMKRKVVVSEKINKYLLHAETLYNRYIGTHSSDQTCPLRSKLRRPLSELRCYRVLGVVDRLMLVLNVVEDCCYVMKVLHKSACPIGLQLRTITPQNVPFMVTMHCYFETESAVYLVLQHGSGGKLWQHISSYFQSLPQTPVHTFKKGNIYHGKTCLETNPHEPKIASFPEESSKVALCRKLSDTKVEESDSVSSQEQSYLDLIQEYTSGAKIDSTESNHNVLPSAVKFSELCDNDIEKSVDLHQIVICNEEDSMPRRVVDEENSNIAPNLSTSKTRHNDEGNQTFESLANNNPTPDLLTHSTNLSYSWNILDTLPTQDLVKNAQRLLESVSETLMHSDIVVSRLEDDKLSVEYHTSTADFASLHNEEDKSQKHSIMDVDSSNAGVEISGSRNRQTTEQKCSSTRRRSSKKMHTVKSLERRISTDDLLGGGAHALTGSLDREWGCGPPRPRLPEGPIRCWGAQLLVCLDCLHRWGVTCRDLHPDNLLLGEKGQLLVTYMCQWEGVDALPSPNAVRKLYAAPEVSSILPVTQAADWWSFGAILYELLTGRSLAVSHPGGIHSHTIIDIPDHVSENAKSLLEELLRYNPLERLGAGVNGTEDLKSHPFFSGVEWQTVLDEGTAT